MKRLHDDRNEDEGRVLKLSRVPVWMSGAGVWFLTCWLIFFVVGRVGAPSSLVDFTVMLEPLCLVLGLIFTLYGIGYHFAINLAYWREVRSEDRTDKVILSGRKRFERRKRSSMRPRSRLT